MGNTFLEIVFKPVWKWLIGMPLEIIGILTFINPDWGNLINYPSISRIISWYWWVIAGLLVWGIGTAWEAAQKIARLREELDHVPTVKAIADNDGQALIIQHVHGDVHVEKEKKQRKPKKVQPKLSENVRKTYPNIVVTKFDSEVLTLKLITKTDNGQTVQVGQGETLERFYVEFVNRKLEGIKTEDAISIYVVVSFYNVSFKLIRIHDKPRWWTIYDPFDEKTWEPKINLEANGKPQRLFLVLRKPNQSQYFIFSRESHKVPNWIIPEFELKSKTTYICIRLSANNYDAKDIWVEMKKNGKNKPLFELLPSDPRKEVSIVVGEDAE
jgi:hypothetical protein